VLAFIPSPSSGAIHLGPLQLRAYGLCIALGVWAAVVVSSRRYKARGGDPNVITSIAVWAVPAGIVGARMYHVATDFQLYTHHPLNAFKIWDGGLGIWGGIALGSVAGVWVARRHHASPPVLFDCVAPAVPLAQAIGRWGNWFNQELFGRPTTLPWGLRIDAAHRASLPARYQGLHTFHPTFLYESLWDLCVVAIVLVVERRWRLRTGTLMGVYIAAYTFGRFFTEYLRIDTAHHIGPFRLNDWTSIIVFVVAVLVLIATNRGRRGGEPAAATVDSGSEDPERKGNMTGAPPAAADDTASSGATAEDGVAVQAGGSGDDAPSSSPSGQPEQR